MLTRQLIRWFARQVSYKAQHGAAYCYRVEKGLLDLAAWCYQVEDKHKEKDT